MKVRQVRGLGSVLNRSDWVYYLRGNWVKVGPVFRCLQTTTDNKGIASVLHPWVLFGMQYEL